MEITGKLNYYIFRYLEKCLVSDSSDNWAFLYIAVLTYFGVKQFHLVGTWHLFCVYELGQTP